MDAPPYLTPIEIPDGQYTGVWGGYTLQFEFDDRDVFVTTKRGIRGINVPVTFRSYGNRIDEESITPTGSSSP